MYESLREVSMRRNWQIQRRLQPTSDAERRWDRVYQHLLEWTQLEKPQKVPQPKVYTPKDEEIADETDRCLRSGINRPAGASTNHSTAGGTASNLPDQ